jgi:hypothetical protein
MGDVLAELVRTTGVTGDGSTRLRDFSSSTETSNFTSYDLLQKPAFAGYSWFNPYDFLKPARSWYLQVYDSDSQGAWKEGHIEYLSIMVMMHTRPDRADTDGDGLNDSEEVNLGLDGFATDSWKTDTDGDGLADNEYFVKGTDPTRKDTDRDGFNDNVDRVPLADVFVRLYIDTIAPVGSDQNDGGSLIEPFASATIGSDTSYSSSYSGSSGNTIPIYHSFSVNVDDSATTVPITIRAWDYDTRTDASGHPYDVHTPINVARDTSYGGCSGYPTWSFTYPIGQPGDYVSMSSTGYCPGSTALYANPIHIIVLTEAPVRNAVFLVTPQDYSSVYNLTNAQGEVTSRRYVGEPRFVAVIANVTDTTYGGSSNEKLVYLLPRSLFSATKLYAVLGDPSKSPTDPVVSGASLSFEGTTGASSDALQSMLVLNITVSPGSNGLARLESYLTSNASGGTVHRIVLVVDTVLVMNLPDDVMRVIAYTPPTNTPTATYRFCSTPNCGGPLTTPSIWDQLWAGVKAVLAICLQLVVSAVIATVNFFVLVGSVLAQFGAWLWNAVQGAAAAVASAVQAAAKVVGQVLEWIGSFVNAIIQSLVQPIVLGFANMLKDLAAGFAELLFGTYLAWRQGSVGQSNPIKTILDLFLPIIMGIAIVLQIVAYLLFPITSVVGLVSGIIITVVLTAIMQAMLTQDNGARLNSPSSSGQQAAFSLRASVQCQAGLTDPEAAQCEAWDGFVVLTDFGAFLLDMLLIPIFVYLTIDFSWGSIVKDLAFAAIGVALTVSGLAFTGWPTERRLALETVGVLWTMYTLCITFADIPKIVGAGPAVFLASIFAAMSVGLNLVGIGLGTAGLAAILSGMC